MITCKSQNEDKTAIFEGWCDFLNYFDSSIRFQLSFLNLAASQETFANSITIPAQGDDFDPIRVEYTQMLQNQLARRLAMNRHTEVSDESSVLPADRLLLAVNNPDTVGSLVSLALLLRRPRSASPLIALNVVLEDDPSARQSGLTQLHRT